MSEKSLTDILDGISESPLTGEGVQRGKVDWDEVSTHFLTEEGQPNNYFQIKNIEDYVVEDLGVDITYSSCHSWLRRLHKKGKGTHTVIKKIFGKKVFYLIKVNPDYTDASVIDPAELDDEEEDDL